MFDGSVSHRNGYIELYSKSKDLISDLATLLTKIDLKPDFISQKADKLGRHRLIIRKREKLKRSLCLFEPNTHKWFILKEHVSGLTTEASDYDEFIRAFKTHYPKLVSDMIRIIYSFQKEGMAPDFGLISEKLGRKSTVTYEFLSKLERWGILESTKQMNKKYWIVKSFLIPDRGDEYGKR